jgi:hypothetical protein
VPATCPVSARLAVLRIKDVWHRLPSYPDTVGGWDIYTAVLGPDAAVGGVA